MTIGIEATAIKLKTLQRHLERIYEVEAVHDVDDFVITDPDLARKLDDGENAREVDEKLLVRQDGDNLDLALYLSPEVVGRLVDDNPAERLHQGNLIEFCAALEGVSHFLYLVWNARFERSVTQLEMEMQAEVDKFVTIAALLARQQGGHPSNLHQWLFAEPVFDAALGAAELALYYDANHYAAKYCLHLENRYLKSSEHPTRPFLNDLRRFYRLGLRDKIRRIESPAR